MSENKAPRQIRVARVESELGQIKKIILSDGSELVGFEQAQLGAMIDRKTGVPVGRVVGITITQGFTVKEKPAVKKSEILGPDGKPIS